MHAPRSRNWPMLLLGLFLSGCGQDAPKSYQVPKESPTQTAAGLPSGHPDISAGTSPAAPAATPRLTWTKPESWNEGAPGQMRGGVQRVASFSVPGEAGKQADVSVIPLSGLAGGTESNVNRWRGQVGLGPLSAEDLTKSAEVVEVAGQTAQLFDIAGTASSTGEPTRILGAIQQRGGMAWFFKMTGNDPLVAKEKAAFVAFLKSVKFEASEMAAGLPAGHPDISTSPAPAPAASADVAADGKPKWEVPSGWKEIPGGQFLFAKFSLTGEGGAQAAVNVSTSAGDGGGLAANVNRWRGQLGQSPWTAAELQQAAKEIPVASGTATLVEMSGTEARTGQPATLVGLIVSQPGQAWFYKLMGDARVVESQKAAFTKFVQTVKY